MTNEKTSKLISTCDSIFKQSGLLRLASSGQGKGPVISAAGSPLDLTGTDGRGGSSGNAALDHWKEGAPVPSRPNGGARSLGIEALDALLPDGGLPTGKVTELSMRGGAAFGTQIALWACRTAQQQATLAGTESWCAFIDPSATLHAPGVKATGVELQRLLVVRPSVSDIERVVVRLSDARVFSVIVLDLIGVPWATTMALARSEQTSRTESVQQRRRQPVNFQGLSPEPQRRNHNWPRTVRQLALKLANTQAQVLLLTDADIHRQAPLPVALRVQLGSEIDGLRLKVLKDSQGRIGQTGTIPWSEWWEPTSPASAETDLSSEIGRAKTLQLREHAPQRQGVGASSRLARTSRASL